MAGRSATPARVAAAEHTCTYAGGGPSAHQQGALSRLPIRARSLTAVKGWRVFLVSPCDGASTRVVFVVRRETSSWWSRDSGSPPGTSRRVLHIRQPPLDMEVPLIPGSVLRSCVHMPLRALLAPPKCASRPPFHPLRVGAVRPRSRPTRGFFSFSRRPAHVSVRPITLCAALVFAHGCSPPHDGASVITLPGSLSTALATLELRLSTAPAGRVDYRNLNRGNDDSDPSGACPLPRPVSPYLTSAVDPRFHSVILQVS